MPEWSGHASCASSHDNTSRADRKRLRADSRRKGWSWRAPLAALLLLSSLGMLAAAAVMGAQESGVAVMFNLAMNAGVCGVIFVYVIGPLLVPAILAGLGRLPGAAGSVTGSMSASFLAGTTAVTAGHGPAPVCRGGRRFSPRRPSARLWRGSLRRRRARP